jgi:hypothetical protein
VHDLEFGVEEVNVLVQTGFDESLAVGEVDQPFEETTTTTSRKHTVS